MVYFFILINSYLIDVKSSFFKLILQQGGEVHWSDGTHKNEDPVSNTTVNV